MKHRASLIGCVTRPRRARTPVVPLMLILLALTLWGCGSGWDDWDDDCCSDYDPVHFVTLYLNVSDQDGQPLEGATVWLNGVAQSLKTLDYFRAVEDCGCDWNGFRYNWRRNEFRVRIPDYSDYGELDVVVSKPGWRNQRAGFSLTSWDEKYISGRATFVMQPATGGGGGRGDEDHR